MMKKSVYIPRRASGILCILMLLFLPFCLFSIVELGYNLQVFYLDHISNVALAVNYLLYASVVLFAYFVSPYPKVVLIILVVFTFIYSSINHFVAELKGLPITVSDIRAIKTALNVAGDYKYVPNILIYKSLIVSFWTILFIILFIHRMEFSHKKVLYLRAVGGSASILLFLVLSLNIHRILSNLKEDVVIEDLLYVYMENGYFPVLLSDMNSSDNTKPADYSRQKVNGILSAFPGGKMTPAGAGRDDPIIIGIMNEAFSDLSVLGTIDNQKNLLDYVYSLKDDPYTIGWGSCLVSIRGTGTANSEFEFLTGDSLKYLGRACPYNYYNMRGVPNLAANLRDEGYYTIAMHPESATNWRRNGVYPEFGFDEFLSYDDYVGYETISDGKDEILNSNDDPEKTGGRVSDLGDYKKLIDVLEEQEAPSFLFNVTMQNHSGYSKLSKSVTEILVDSDPIINADEESATYETLISISDDAIEYLVEYLRNYNKPVILVLFGDHQPDLPDEVENALMARSTEGSSLAKSQTKYMTQYFIWANYDTGFRYTASDVVSANYLGVLTRKVAGCKLTAFENYLLAQMEEIPAMNRFGYLADDGEWHSYDEENKYSHWFKNYELIQYNNLFDVEENQELFHVDRN